MTKQQSQGTCQICGESYGKSGFTRHLKSCRTKNAKPPSGKAAGPSVHIVVEPKYASDYWLHLEAEPDLTLGDLDAFLRDIWLECCGHMSAFEKPRSRQATGVGPTGMRGLAQLFGVAARFDDFDDFDEFGDTDLGFDELIRDALPLKEKVNYTYDFGSSTELTVRVVNEFGDGASGEGIRILARNDAPEYSCVNCGKPATQICTECGWNGPGEGYFCKRCLKKHDCGDEMALPVVNSPRSGICGYTG